MAQIRGVINQTHRNHDLEIFKKMYNSISTKSLDSEYNDNDNNDSESDDDSDLEEIKNEANTNNLKNWEAILSLWDRMLEAESKAIIEAENDNINLINDSFYDESATSFLTNRIHPQRDNNVKWMLDNLFIVNLGPPNYIDQL